MLPKADPDANTTDTTATQSGYRAGATSSLDFEHIDLFGALQMNSEKINSWLTLGANLGVVFGLILLIVEISQNTEMMRAQINQMRADSAMTQQHAYFNSEYLPEIVQKIRTGNELSGVEIGRYGSYARAFHRSQDNNLWQYNQGYLGDNIPRSIEGGVRLIVGGSQYGIALWDSQKHGFTSEYVAFVEAAIADLRDPTQ